MSNDWHVFILERNDPLQTSDRRYFFPRFKLISAYKGSSVVQTHGFGLDLAAGAGKPGTQNNGGGAVLLHGFGWHYCPACFLISFSLAKNHVSPLPRRQN
jgi:hypothetical protein